MKVLHLYHSSSTLGEYDCIGEKYARGLAVSKPYASIPITKSPSKAVAGFSVVCLLERDFGKVRQPQRLRYNIKGLGIGLSRTVPVLGVG